MTSESDFQAMLDLHPDDHGTRLVFADWLQERGDERAEGYRALGAQRIVLCDSTAAGVYMPHEPVSVFNVCPHSAWTPDGFCEVPADWFAALEGFLVGTDDEKRERHNWVMGMPGWWQEFRARRFAESATASAFARLPAERRAELLRTTEGVAA